jgi:hypothetical protein
VHVRDWQVPALPAGTLGSQEPAGASQEEKKNTKSDKATKLLKIFAVNLIYNLAIFFWNRPTPHS